MSKKIALLIVHKINDRMSSNTLNLKDLLPENFEKELKNDLEETTHVLTTIKESLTDFRLDHYKKPYIEALNDFFIKRYLPFEARINEASIETIKTYRDRLDINVTKLDRNIVNIENALNQKLITSCSYFARTIFYFYMNCVTLSILLKQEEYRLAKLIGEDPVSLELLHNNYTSLVTQSFKFIQETTCNLKKGRLSFITFKIDTNKSYDQILSFNVEYKDAFESKHSRDSLKNCRIVKKANSNSIYDTFTRIEESSKKYTATVPIWQKEYEKHKINISNLLNSYEIQTITPILDSLLIANVNLNKLNPIKLNH